MLFLSSIFIPFLFYFILLYFFYILLAKCFQILVNVNIGNINLSKICLFTEFDKCNNKYFEANFKTNASKIFINKS